MTNIDKKKLNEMFNKEYSPEEKDNLKEINRTGQSEESTQKRKMKVREIDIEEAIKINNDAANTYRDHLSSSVTSQINKISDKEILESLQSLQKKLTHDEDFYSKNVSDMRAIISISLIKEYQDENTKVKVDNILKKYPEILADLEKINILDKGILKLNEANNPEIDCLSDFKTYIEENREILIKNRDGYFEKFMKALNKLAVHIFGKDQKYSFNRQSLFANHGKDFVKNVIPERNEKKKNKPGK